MATKYNYRTHTNTLDKTQKWQDKEGRRKNYYLGTVTLIKIELEQIYTIQNDIIIPHRAQLSTLELRLDQTSAFHIWNIYIGKAQTTFFKKLTEALTKNTKTNTVICGDMNVVTDVKDVKIKRNFRLNPAGKIWIRHIRTNKLLDAFRARNPDKEVFTITKHNQARRIDQIYITKNLQQNVKKFEYKINIMSDHNFMSSIVLENVKRKSWGKGTWKNDPAMYEDEIVADRFKEVYNFYLEQKKNIPNITAWWDQMKLGAKELLLEREAELKTNKLRTSKELENKLADRNIGLEDMTRIIKKLKQIEDEKTREHCRRYKIKEFEENERPSRYFYDKLKAKRTKSQIEILENEEKTEMYKTEKEILNETKRFYDELWNNAEIVEENKQDAFIKELENINMTDSERDLLNKQISKEEVEKVIKNLKNNKSPGADGLSAEFYKK